MRGYGIREGQMILGVIVLTVVTQMSDGRVATQQTVQPNMEECHRLAEIVNKTNGAGKYKFFCLVPTR